jgi:hypothetical protein
MKRMTMCTYMWLFEIMNYTETSPDLLTFNIFQMNTIVD